LIEESEDRLITGYNKSIIGLQKIHFSQPYYAPAPSVGGIKWWCASDVCLSRTSDLSREQSQWAGGLLSLA